ncbi:hypothetical protein Emag_007047 [Eimeria magna]
MGEASQAPSRAIQTLGPSDLYSSSFLSLDSAAASDELKLPVHKRGLRPRWNIRFRLVLASIASAAAVAALIAVCAAAYLRAAPLQLTRRMLSEGVSADSIKGLAACGDTSGNASGDDLQVFFQEKELGPSPAKKVKVEDEGFEANGEAGFQPHASAGSHDKSYIAAAGAAATAPEVESPLESRMSSKEFMAAQALVALWGEGAPAIPEQTAPGLALHQRGQLPLGPQQQAQPPPAEEQQMQHAPASQQQAQLSPALQTQAGAAPVSLLLPVPPFLAVATVPNAVVVPSIGVVLSIPPGAKGPQPQPASVQLAAPLPVAPFKEPPQNSSPGSSLSSRSKHLLSNGGLQLIDPLGEWEPPSAEAGGQDVLEHAFARLPRIAGGDHPAYSSFFSPERATNAVNTGITIVQAPLLRKLSALLAQDELSVGQLRTVADLAERLIIQLIFIESRELARSPALAAESLGFRFLLLDMTVSSLQLLGVPRSGPWWDRMVSGIPDEYNCPLTKWVEDLPRYNFNLMTRLTAAIRVLKAGRRPEPKVLVHLKRCLFCCTRSPLRFLKPAWDRWRDDDREFYQQFEGRPRQNDPARPGPSHQSAS